MTKNIKPHISMSFWFSLGLMVSIIILKPNLIDFGFNKSAVKPFDGPRIKAPTRIFYLDD